MKRIIANKKIELTNDEFALYQKICASYDTTTLDGKSLFIGLFETDEHGIIISLIPPTARYASMEVFMFLMAIQQSQHLKIMHQQVKNFIDEGNKIIEENVKKVKS